MSLPDETGVIAALALAERANRGAAAVAFARLAGADALTIFIHDPAIESSLPAPGFPQTLRNGRGWIQLVETAIARGSAEGRVHVESGEVAAIAAGASDGTAAVLSGGRVNEGALSALRLLLPLLGALLRAEAKGDRSEMESKMARESAAQAESLATKLDAMRFTLQNALSVAETATRARDGFLATVSHELRTPLTSIIGWIQLLRHGHDEASLEDGLEALERNAKAQARLIEDILDFSRINAGKLQLEVRAMDLVDVIAAAIAIIRPAAIAKHIKVVSVLDSGAGLVSGDPDRLQQVVWNLLSNAVKFTARDGTVQVRLERVDSHSELTVSDSGIGISPAFLPYVFDRFSQADNSTTREYAGLGLGLGIVRHLVELHGGTVRVFSAGLGTGSTFVVRLPLPAAHSLGESEAEARDDACMEQLQKPSFADLSGISVLVVEDHDDSRRMLENIISRSGAVVHVADSSAAALRVLAAEQPDILVSDIEMPGEDGFSLIRKIRLQEGDGQHIPAIALTAHTRSADRVRAMEAGFQLHMSKPVEPEELMASIRSLLAARNIERIRLKA